MKWLYSAHKASRRFLNSHQYHYGRAGSCPKSYQMQRSSLFSSRSYSTSTILNVSIPSSRLLNDKKLENGVKDVDLEIISRETIKPSTPTPYHLRTFNLSIIDQYFCDVYAPLILFLPNSDNTSVSDVLTKRSKHLKETLSKILTQFYPFAGKVKNNCQIECNDEGIYYIEARVNQKLQDFLCHPDDEKVRELMPQSPCTAESSIGNYVIGIQVNIFLCGGIGISTSISHKIFDGHTFYMFMKAWAAAARGSPEIISPTFVASEIFPNNPCSKHSFPSRLLTTKTLKTKRFVFDSTALALLKTLPVASSSSRHPPTRMEATTAVLWKAVAKATSKLRPFGALSPHVLFLAVNIRKRASPPLPEDSIGNLFDVAGAICFPEWQPGLPRLMGKLRESIAKVNSGRVESLKGEKGHEIIHKELRRSNMLMDIIGEGGYIGVTSLLNSGIYTLDFGWGKPIWFYVTNSGLNRIIALNETKNGNGVEAMVSLRPEEMEILEHDAELLSYATVNSSPLC